MNLVVEIQKMGHRGLGIGRCEGKVVLVPFSAPGDRVEVKVTRTHRNFIEAEISSIVHPSPLRRKPRCPFFAKCGGCQLQHFPVSLQRSLKEEIFRDLLEHYGKVEDKKVKDMLLASHEFEYRYHIELHVDWGGEPLLGFMARKDKKVIPLNRCLLACAGIQSAISEVRKLLERAQAKMVTQIAISSDYLSNNLSLTLFCKRRIAPQVEKVLGDSAQEIPALRGIYLIAQSRKTPLTLWEKAKGPPGVLYALPPVDRIGEIILEVWPGIFRQVNPEANRVLVSTVLEQVQEQGAQRVLELYGGMGNFTIPVSFVAQEVVVIEINSRAVENAKANALRYGRENIRWTIGPVKDKVKFLKKDYFDLIIMDPPRSGAKEILKEIFLLKPKNILYISCEPATLARDIHFLQKNGFYGVEMVQPLDMFPQTFHMESITFLKKI